MTDFPKVPEGILGEETTEKTNTELFLSLVGQYFPEAIKDGEVDFTALKEEMGEFPQVSGEHYDFTWAGKQAAKKEAMSDIYGRTLKYKPQDSLNPDTTENIYIEGDNLEALKLLRRNYHGKIKMIYIDPPYNTGNDFVYRDNFTMSEDELAELSGNTVNGERLQKNTNDKSKYHTNWLNMMYPRLKIARDLLTDDGVIFISIDDNEQENLLKICSEIFGTNNYCGTIPYRKRTMKTDVPFGISQDYEWVLVFAKSPSFFAGVPVERKYYSSPDYPNDRWRLSDLTTQKIESQRPNSAFDLVDPKTGKVYPYNPKRLWAITKDTFNEYSPVSKK
ncbi:MAG: site-specific DNA-methyltransferase [Clostridia bacterium]|nr:site-specific DNA-methyltransferase [Clostridia bacterium]